MDTLRVFTAFSGYDSQCLALERLGIPYELVGWSETDPAAIRAHNALFPHWAGRNYGDIAAIDWAGVPDFELFTYSFPCTDISTAGKRRGLAEGSGTASSLLWECRRAIETKRPKYLLMENVKALLSRKFRPLFSEWERTVARMRYTNFVRVLNAKDYGVPQNRERVFMVSILGEASYHFPSPIPLTLRLGDLLEQDVPQKYFMSERMVNYILSDSTGGFKGGINIKSVDSDCAATLTTRMHKSGRQDNYLIAALRGRDPENPSNRKAGAPTAQRLEIGGMVANTLTTVQKDNLVLSYTRDAKGKVVRRTLKDIANTVHTSTGQGGNTDSFVIQRGRGFSRGGVRSECPSLTGSDWQHNHALPAPTPAAHFLSTPDGSPSPASRRAQPESNLPTPDAFAIRRLTPRECLRLMGVADADIDRLQRAGISDTQQYRLAGNSIVVDVLCHIFRKLFIDPKNENRQLTLF